MSAINSLINELTKSADKWSESNMLESARLCRDAAIIILELQNDVELLNKIWYQAYSEAQNFKAENAKLRKLIGMFGNVCDGTSEVCEYCKNYSATNNECMMLKQMCELGMEAD